MDLTHCTFLCLMFFIYPVFIIVEAQSSDSNKNEVDTCITDSNCSCTPPYPTITVGSPTQEQFNLTFSGDSLEAKGEPSTTVGRATGGIIGTSVYTFCKFSFYWSVSENGQITLQVFVVHFNNNEYGSFEEALLYGAVLIIVIPVDINNCTNTAYNGFVRSIQKIKKPGDNTAVQSTCARQWFMHSSKNASYVSFKASFYDRGMKQMLNNVTINKFSSGSYKSSMSITQFQQTLESLKKSNPSPELYKLTQDTYLNGISIYAVPG